MYVCSWLQGKNENKKNNSLTKILICKKFKKKSINSKESETSAILDDT